MFLKVLQINPSTPCGQSTLGDKGATNAVDARGCGTPMAISNTRHTCFGGRKATPFVLRPRARRPRCPTLAGIIYSAIGAWLRRRCPRPKITKKDLPQEMTLRKVCKNSAAHKSRASLFMARLNPRGASQTMSFVSKSLDKRFTLRATCRTVASSRICAGRCP